MKDIILDENGDLKIENGDLVIGDCDVQNKALLLELPKGAIKSAPEATVGVQNYLESEDTAAMLREIKLRFSNDGMAVKQLEFNNEGQLITDAPYK